MRGNHEVIQDVKSELFVDADNCTGLASDENDGLSRESPLLTMEAACARMQASGSTTHGFTVTFLTNGEA
jgi:hypothetical protein